MQAKTPILSFAAKHFTPDQFTDYTMAYANAKVESLKSSDPVTAQEWQDYFLTRASANSVPPGVVAFSNKLQALAQRAAENPNIVLANITGEQVMDVVFKDYQKHLQPTNTPSVRAPSISANQ